MESQEDLRCQRLLSNIAGVNMLKERLEDDSVIKNIELKIKENIPFKKSFSFALEEVYKSLKGELCDKLENKEE